MSLSEQEKHDLKNLIQSIAMEMPAKEPPLYIRIFGSSILVIVATLLIGVFQHIFSNISEMKQHHHCLVTKDEFNTAKSAQWKSIKECQDQFIKVIAIEERMKIIIERIDKLEKENAVMKEKLYQKGVKTISLP